MSFQIHFNAASVTPIQEFTPEMREQWYMACCMNPSDEDVHAAKVEAARKYRKLQDDRHKYFLDAAGAKHNGMSIGEAKRYVRARAASSLREAFEVLETALSQAGKVNEKVDIANEIVKRAVGPHAVPNSISDAKKLTELAPVDAIDVALEAFGRGECDEAFVKTLLGLLGAKVNGLKVEEELSRKSKPKTGDKMQKPPSGKVV